MECGGKQRATPLWLNHALPPHIDLSAPLSLRTSFLFPLQSPLARREVLIGALWLLVPGIGWILNMGHRVMLTHRMQHGLPAWPAWRNYRALMKHGLITLAGMIEYHLPATLCGALGAMCSRGLRCSGLDF